MMSLLKVAGEIISIPDFNRRTWRALYRHLRVVSYRPLSELLSTLLEPTMLLLALGWGLARWLPEIDGRPYGQFVLPAVVALTAIFVPFWEVAFTVFAQLRKPATYWVLLQSPLTGEDVGRAEILWAACKGTVSSLCLLALGAGLGWVRSELAWLAVVVVFPAAVMSASVGLWWACRVHRSISLVAIQASVIGPLALWSDTLFPFSSRGEAAEWLVALSPVGHVSHALRALTTGELAAEFFLNLSVIWALASILSNVAVRAFVRRLIPS